MAEAPIITIGEASVEPVMAKSANMNDWMTYYACNVMNPKVLVGIFLLAYLIGVLLQINFLRKENDNAQ